MGERTESRRAAGSVFRAAHSAFTIGPTPPPKAAQMRWLLLCVLVSASTFAHENRSGRFERITPAEAGYSAEKLQGLATFLRESGSDSLLLLHDGKVFFEWGNTRKKLFVHSIRKALLNSLIGIHLGENCLRLDRTLAELGIDDLPPALTDQEKSATLEQLLQSRSGVYHAAAAEAESMIRTRPSRGSHAPGTHYYYNNWDFNVAGAIFEQCTGRSVYAAFDKDIARPLGMLDWANRIVDMPSADATIDPRADGTYQLEPERSQFRAYRFRLSAHDLALYGQLYLQRGRWKGRQIVPADWIDRSTRPISMTEPEYGLAYGMLWDVVVPDPQDRRASFFHTGAGVHMLGVYPKHGLVMVHRVDTERDYHFDDGDLYQVIRKVHGARIAAKPATALPEPGPP